MKVIMPAWIVNEDLKQMTIEAVESFGDEDLVIIDNDSPMGGGVLRGLADTYVLNKSNLGYAKAMNQGFRLFPDEDFYVFGQNDTRVSPNWKQVALDILKDPTVGSVHFRMLAYDEPFSYGNETWTTGKERWSHSGFVVLRNILQEFDENFINSYEDYDFWYRLRINGYKTAYTNRACFQHKDSWSQQFKPDRNENDKRNYEYYNQKHGEYPDLQFARLYPEQMTVPWKPFP